MIKKKKTYRLNQVTVEQIQVLREFYASEGLFLSDSQVIEKAIMLAMDIPDGRLEKYEINAQADCSIRND